MKFVDKEEDAFQFTNFFHDGFDAFLELPAVLGSCDHEGEIEGDDFFIAENFRNVARGDLLGEAFDDGGFTDASFTDEDGIIFGAATENLDDSFDFVFTADDGIEFIFAGEFGEVAAEGFEGGGFDVLAGRARGSAGRGFGGGRFLESACGFGAFLKIGIEFFEDFLAGAFDIDLEGFEDAGGNAVTFAEKTEEDVFGADVGVVEGFGFFAGEGEDFFDSGGVGNVPSDFGIGAGTDLFFDFHANGFEVEAHFLQDIDGDALAEFDQAEKDMFGADIVVVKPIGLFAGEGEYLLGAWGEIVHRV